VNTLKKLSLCAMELIAAHPDCVVGDPKMEALISDWHRCEEQTARLTALQSYFRADYFRQLEDCQAKITQQAIDLRGEHYLLTLAAELSNELLVPA